MWFSRPPCLAGVGILSFSARVMSLGISSRTTRTCCGNAHPSRAWLTPCTIRHSGASKLHARRSGCRSVSHSLIDVWPDWTACSEDNCKLNWFVSAVPPGWISRDNRYGMFMKLWCWNQSKQMYVSHKQTLVDTRTGNQTVEWHWFPQLFNVHSWSSFSFVFWGYHSLVGNCWVMTWQSWWVIKTFILCCGILLSHVCLLFISLWLQHLYAMMMQLFSDTRWLMRK